jgi:hypothetical protein
MDWLSHTAIPALVDGWHTIEPAVTTFLKTGLAVAGFIADNLHPIMAGLAAALVFVVVPAFVAWAIAAGTAALATMTALAPIVLPIVAIGAAVGLLYKAWESDFGGIRTNLTAFWEQTAKPIFGSIALFFTEGLPTAIATITSTFSRFTSMGAAFIENIKAGIMQGWDGFVSWFLENLASIIPGGQATLAALGIAPGRALGGQVTAGRAYTVGENGRETFVPGVSGSIVPNGGGGGMSVTVHVAGSVVSERELGQAVRQVLLDVKRRNPTAGLA